MKSPIIFFLGFMLGFSLDVRVKAEDSVQLRNITSLSLNNRVLQEPKGCLEQSAKCAFQISLGRKLDIPFAGGHWFFSQNSMLIRQRDWSELRLVEGMLRLRAEAGARGTIVTELVQVVLEGVSGSTDVFIEKSKDQVRVVNVGEQEVAISRRTAQGFQVRRELLPPGTEILVERPSSRSGEVEIGLPVPFDFEDQVIREARLFEGKKAEFHLRVAQLIEKRNQAAELVAPMHEALAKRTIASIERRREAAKIGKAQREARDRELRMMFRKRVLEVQ
jgi:hypothetical protein